MTRTRGSPSPALRWRGRRAGSSSGRPEPLRPARSTAARTSASSRPSRRARTRDVPGRSERIADLGDDGRRGAQRADPALDRREVEAREALVDDELEHRDLRVDERADGAVAALQTQVARVEPVRRDRDVGLRGEALLVAEGAQRGLLAGGIRVEGEDDLARRGIVAHHAAQHRDVVEPNAVPHVAIAVVTPARWHAMTSV